MGLEDLLSRSDIPDDAKEAIAEALASSGGQAGPSPRRRGSLRALFDEMSQGVIYRGPDGRISRANRAAERLLGVGPGELVGAAGDDPRWRTVREDGSECPPSEFPSIVALRSGREVRDVVLGLDLPGGSRRRWVAVNSVPRLAPGESTPFEVFSIITDITERLDATAALRASEAQFREIFDASPAALLEMDFSPARELMSCLADPSEERPEDLPSLALECARRIRVLRANRVALTLFGLGSLEDMPADTTVLWDAGTHETFAASLESQVRGEPAHLLPTSVVDCRGRQHHVLLSWSPSPGCEDTWERCLVSLVDVTEVEEARAAREAAEGRLRRVLESSPMGLQLYRLCADGRLELTAANAAADRIVGVDSAVLIGRAIEEAFPSLAHSEVPAAFGHVACTGQPWHFEQVDYAEGQVARAYEAHAFQTELGHMAVALVDLTERTRAQEALRLFRLAIDHSGEAAYWTNPEGRFIYVNETACRTLGYSRDELLRMSIWDIDPDFLPERWPARWEEIAARRSFVVPTRHRTRDGRDIAVEVSVNYVAGGGRTWNCAFARDVTARRRMEEELVRERDFSARVLETIGSLVVVMDTGGRIVLFNRACELCTGYSADEVSGKPVWSVLIAPEDEVAVRRVFGALRSDAVPSQFENVWLTRDGRRRTIAWSNSVITGTDGRVEYVLGTGIDVTEHRRSERERQRIFDMSLDMLCVGSLDGTLYQANPAWTRVLGWSAEEILGRSFQEFTHPDDVPATLAVGAELAGGRPVAGFGNRYRCKDGSWRHLSWSCFPLLDEGMVVSVARDITESRRTEQAIRSIASGGSAQVGAEFFESMALQLAEALEADRTLIGELLGTNTIRTLSHCAGGAPVEGLTYSLPGTPCANVVGQRTCVYPEGVAALFPEDAALAQMGAEAYVGVPLFDGEGAALGLIAAVYTRPIAAQEEQLATAVIRTFADRTAAEIERRRADQERRRLEAQVHQSQRLESLGVLAGGVAHDFNNVLAAIMGYAELARLEAPATGHLASHLDQIMGAADRARDLVQQILAFTRQAPSEARPVSLALIVREALRFLRSSLPTTVQIAQHVNPSSGFVSADPTQMHQVVMNLCTNAAHAMRDRGGVLEVRLEPVTISDAGPQAQEGAAAGDYVRLSVIDTGCGMAPDVLERVFEPFFTTKPKGEGTGLGLAVTHGIVAAHGGTIRIRSELGQGTTFHVYLPRCTEEGAADVSALPGAPKGHGRVLLVDDEPSLARMAESMLVRLGYTVSAHTTTSAALAEFAATPGAFDLVVSDQTMPHMTGLELAARLRAMRPDVPIVLMTGFSQQLDRARARADGIASVVMKPYTLAKLAQAASEALNGAAPESAREVGA